MFVFYSHFFLYCFCVRFSYLSLAKCKFLSLSKDFSERKVPRKILKSQIFPVSSVIQFAFLFWNWMEFTLIGEKCLTILTFTWFLHLLKFCQAFFFLFTNHGHWSESFDISLQNWPKIQMRIEEKSRLFLEIKSLTEESYLFRDIFFKPIIKCLKEGNFNLCQKFRGIVQ